MVYLFATIDSALQFLQSKSHATVAEHKLSLSEKKKRQPNQELSVSKINMSEANQQPKEMLPSNEVANAQRDGDVAERSESPARWRCS